MINGSNSIGMEIVLPTAKVNLMKLSAPKLEGTIKLCPEMVLIIECNNSV